MRPEPIGQCLEVHLTNPYIEFSNGRSLAPMVEAHRPRRGGLLPEGGQRIRLSARRAISFDLCLRIC